MILQLTLTMAQHYSHWLGNVKPRASSHDLYEGGQCQSMTVISMIHLIDRFTQCSDSHWWLPDWLGLLRFAFCQLSHQLPPLNHRKCPCLRRMTTTIAITPFTKSRFMVRKKRPQEHLDTYRLSYVWLLLKSFPLLTPNTVTCIIGVGKP